LCNFGNKKILVNAISEVSPSFQIHECAALSPLTNQAERQRSIRVDYSLWARALCRND
jgi:hypothetical protein